MKKYLKENQFQAPVAQPQFPTPGYRVDLRPLLVSTGHHGKEGWFVIHTMNK